jgi:DNA-directed RNA polymerase subunit RPC12/RpoP
LIQQGLVCAECGSEAPPDARGWQAHITVGPEHAEDEEEEVAIFCPECIEREFGGS